MWRAAAVGAVVSLAAAVAVAQDDLAARWSQAMEAAARAYGLARTDEAVVHYEEALALAGMEIDDQDEQRLAVTLLNIAPAYRAVGRAEDAAAAMERGIVIEERILGPDNTNLISRLPVLAGIYADLERYDDAEAVYHRTIGLMSDVLGEMNPRTVTIREYLATLLHRAGRTDEALELFGAVVEQWEIGLGPDHMRQAVSYTGYAQMLRDAGRIEEAEVAERRADEIAAIWQAGR